MRLLGFYWGILGVLGILVSAVWRLSAKVVEMGAYSLSPLQWAILIIFALYMGYAEGYKGFYLNFAPRVVARANYFRQAKMPRLGFLMFLLAPLYCMGYLHATRKRKITSWIITATIVIVVMVVGFTPQPWRGLIDAGVVLGLGLGIGSILHFWIQIERGTWEHKISLDLPE